MVRALLACGGRIAGVSAVLIALASPALVQAQAVHPGASIGSDGLLPAWYDAWSVLRPMADLPRVEPGIGGIDAGITSSRRPVVGAFWNAGNPGAIPFDVDEDVAVFAAGIDERTGTFHRPLDPGTFQRRRAEGAGWRPIDDAGAVVGRVTLESTSMEEGVFSNVMRPYSSGPFAVADTSGTDLTRMAAGLEGAAGWKLGGFGLGLGLGFRAQETRTVGAPVPRRSHAAGPAMSVGVVRPVSGEALRLGGWARWQRLDETTRAYTVGASTIIFELDGYDEVIGRNISALYHRRMNRTSSSVGATADGTFRHLDWTLWIEQATSEERHFNERMNNPRTDLWNSDATTFGAALRRPVRGDATISATAAWTTLDGEARPRPPPGEGVTSAGEPPAFVVDERVVDLLVEVRVPMPDQGWTIAAVGAVSAESRERTDTRIPVSSNLELRTRTLHLEVLREVRPDLSLSVGGALGTVLSGGSIPLPEALGPAYQRWIAPELAHAATGVGTRSGHLGVRWESPGGHGFWARLKMDHFGPDGGSTIPGLPSGDRQRMSLSVGASLAGS